MAERRDRSADIHRRDGRLTKGRVIGHSDAKGRIREADTPLRKGEDLGFVDDKHRIRRGGGLLRRGRSLPRGQPLRSLSGDVREHERRHREQRKQAPGGRPRGAEQAVFDEPVHLARDVGPHAFQVEWRGAANQRANAAMDVFLDRLLGHETAAA